MGFLCRSILLLTLLLAAGSRVWAESAEDRAFRAARAAFVDTFYARADAQLGEFSKKYPASPRLPEAILLQAQARLKLTNYTGAIELLKANEGKAGTNADQYLFWLGKAYSGKGDWPAASDTFASLLKAYPASPRALEATVEEAAARTSLAPNDPTQWQRVIGLLQQTNGIFQETARTNAGSEFLPPGRLLLGEALLATKSYPAAEAALQISTNRPLTPKLAWQWQYLLCRILWADGRTNAAVQGATNLVAAAANTGQTNLLAESAAYQANLLERIGQTNDAIIAYQRNLAAGVPPERQRQALLKISELYLAQNRIPQAAQTLEQFLGQYPDAVSADLALLSLGELRLRQFGTEPGTSPVTSVATNSAAATNGLHSALESFSALVKRFPQSPLFGKAQLDLGWCHLREGRLAEAQAAFQAAVERLPFSPELGTAYFRLADAQFQQTNFGGAIRSYQAIIDKFAAVPEVRTNLFEPALYQMVRAGLTSGDLLSATNALQELRTWHPQSVSTARAVLLAAQDLTQRGESAEARRILQDFDKATPDAPLRAERGLEIAKTWERERKWPEAIAQYTSWLGSFTNQEAVATAEYYRAYDTALLPAGETNALPLYTAFVAHFPSNKLTPYAEMWLANYHYNRQDYWEAERRFKLISQSTNWPPSELTYQAQLNAGKAAVNRSGMNDARYYFTNLYNNLNGPSNSVRFEALFEYGKALMQQADPTDTNQLANCKEAISIFGLICKDYATNQLALQAWLKRGDCYKHWALAKQQYDSLADALNAYQHVCDAPQADIELRSEAKLGLAVTLENWASHKSGPEQTKLLEQALDHCLDVVYDKIILRDGEQAVAYWVNQAGLRAFSLADTLQAWSQEVKIYQRLTNSVWPNPPAWMVKQVAKAQENLDRQKEGR